MKALLRALAALLDALFSERPVFVPAPPPAPAPAPAAPPPPPEPAPLADPAAFYAALRRELKRLTQQFVDGTEALLAALAGLPVAYVAYALATAYHETGRTMQPVREKGTGDGPDPDPWDDYLEQYDTGRKAERLGNTPAADGDGVRYAGRGHVQLTGLANYQRVERELGVPAVADPDIVLRPDISARIMREGMLRGWFTGKRFRDYLPDRGPASRQQFADARRIINGTDRAEIIATYAEVFQDALVAGGWRTNGSH